MICITIIILIIKFYFYQTKICLILILLFLLFPAFRNGLSYVYQTDANWIIHLKNKKRKRSAE